MQVLPGLPGRHVMVAVAAALLAAFTACTTPYHPPVVEGNQSFVGLDNYLTQYPDVHAVFVHGMCTHDESWASARKADLVSRLGGTASAESWPQVEPGHIAVY